MEKGINPEVGYNKLTDGLFIANNISYVERKLIEDFRPPIKLKNGLRKHIIFKNNLFLNKDVWPSGSMASDESPIYKNPKFRNLGGLQIKDYIMNNVELIKNIGIKISNILNDAAGIASDLEVKVNILGNPVQGLPDFGAIEIP